MTDWVAEHRSSISFVVWIVVGCTLILVALIEGNQPALIALGAGALGLPGFSTAAGRRDEVG